MLILWVGHFLCIFGKLTKILWFFVYLLVFQYHYYYIEVSNTSNERMNEWMSGYLRQMAPTMASGCQLRYLHSIVAKPFIYTSIHTYIYIEIVLNGVFVMSTAIQYTEFGNFSFGFSKRQLINQRLFAHSQGNENPITLPLCVSFTLLSSKPQLFMSEATIVAFFFISYCKCLIDREHESKAEIAHYCTVTMSNVYFYYYWNTLKLSTNRECRILNIFKTNINYSMQKVPNFYECRTNLAGNRVRFVISCIFFCQFRLCIFHINGNGCRILHKTLRIV